MNNKKKVYFILMMVVAMLLCASCGTKGNEQGSQVPGDTDVLEKPDEPMGDENLDALYVCIRIQVNPEFRLYVDDAGNVQSVVCVNKDAEDVCKNLNLHGRPCQDAFALLLEEMDKSGYLEKNTVKLDVYIPESQGTKLPEWQNKVEKNWQGALQQSQVGCSYEISIQHVVDDTPKPEENTPENNEPEDNPVEEEFDKIERDSNGNIIMTVDTDQDGNTVTDYYDNYPTVRSSLITFLDGTSQHYYYHADGTIEKCVEIMDHVTIEIFYQNEEVDKQILTDDRGTLIESFFVNGVLSKEIETLATQQTEKLYDANGTMISMKVTDNQYFRLEEYHQDGWLQHMRVENQGSWLEEYYHAKDVLMSQESSDGWKNVFDANGNKLESYGFDNHGKPSRVFYLADGRWISYTHEPDGTVTKAVYRGENCESCIEDYKGPETATP